MIVTNLGRHMGPANVSELPRCAQLRSGSGLLNFKSLGQGAATSVWLAVSDKMEGVGVKYCENASISTPASYAVDPDAEQRLWSMSVKFVGESFD